MRLNYSLRASCTILVAFLFTSYFRPARALDISQYSPVSVYSTDPTTPDTYLSESSVTLLPNTPPSDALVLSYNHDHLFQQIDGFGAALTDSSVININKLSPMIRTKLLHMLFSQDSGLNLNYLRVPVGASDYSLQWYSYLDLPKGEADTDLSGFNASAAYPTIQLLKEILEINPNVRVMLTPWSPPGWMKTNESMMNGSLKNDMYEVLSQYLMKSLEAFESQGIPVALMSIQNEPFYGTSGYPSMFMTAEEQIELINHFGPLLHQSGYSTQLLGLDHNFIYRTDADHIYSETRPWLAGIAYHCYEGDVDDLMGSTTPFYQTECTGVEEGTPYEKTLHSWLQTQVIDGGLMGSKLALGWNLVLDEKHGPYIGWCNNCRGMVDINSQTETITVNPELVAIAHASKYVLPGAYRMETRDYKSKDFSYIGYANPNGSYVLVVENRSDKPMAFVVPDVDGRYYRIRVPANGVSTVKILDHELPARMLSGFVS